MGNNNRISSFLFTIVFSIEGQMCNQYGITKQPFRQKIVAFFDQILLESRKCCLASFTLEAFCGLLASPTVSLMPVSSRAFKCWCIHFLISIYSGTYFSENALLPGLVHSNFKEDFRARQYLTSLTISISTLFYKISKHTNAFHFFLYSPKQKDIQIECLMLLLLLSSNN